MLNLAVLVGFGIVVAEILFDGAVTLMPSLPSVLPPLAVAAAVCALGLAGCMIAASRPQRPPIAHLMIVAASVICVPFLSYWQVWGWR